LQNEREKKIILISENPDKSEKNLKIIENFQIWLESVPFPK
jgi:hypothetical protein